MTWKSATGVTMGVVLLALCTSQAIADMLVVGGHQMRSPGSFVISEDEIYAPILNSLTHLGASHTVSQETIEITTGARRQIVIYRERLEATKDGMLRKMPALPQERNGLVYLPARAVGSLLGCAVRWDEESRTLFIHPWVKHFSFKRLHDCYRLTVKAENPIGYRTGELTEPPRLFVDLLDMDLAQIPSEFSVEDGYLKTARIHQNTLAPDAGGDVVRIAVEMAELRQSRIRESGDLCTLKIDFPLPDAEELPPDLPPVILTGMDFERISPRLAAVKIATYGMPYCTSVDMYDPLTIAVDIANAQSQIAMPFLPVSDHVAETVSIAPAPGRPGSQRVTIALHQPIGEGIAIDEGEIRILLGQFELSELKVVIDAGHGGHDAGAIGRTGLREKDFNLDVSRRVYRLLKALGVNACLTRVDDNPVRPWDRGNREQQRIELLSRCSIANHMEADLFVSIHANARRSNPMEHRGTETYYRKSDSFAFARVMQRALVESVGLPDGGVIRHPKSIIVLSYTQMPAVLVEIGYLSHPLDEAQLASDEIRERAAHGIVNGIRRYVEEGGILVQLEQREETHARTRQPVAAE